MAADPKRANQRTYQDGPGVGRAVGEGRTLAASMPRLMLEARRVAATVIHGLHGRRRAGPGENYSVLGVIGRGTAVNETATKGGWAQIDPPTDAYAFIAAIYLRQEVSGNLAANHTPSTETTLIPASAPTPVTETQPIATESTNAAPAATETSSPAPTVVDTSTAPVIDTNLPPRIVTHEGVVGPVGSIIAPTAYVLYDPDTRQNINFLYTTSTNLNISRYNGMRIVVTGEEGLAQRWNNTPLLTIQRIEVLETNAVPKVYYPSPRQSH